MRECFVSPSLSLSVWCLLYVQLSEVQGRLADDLDTVEAASVTRHSAVITRLDQHNATLAGLSAMTERLVALASQLEGLEQQVAHLQDSRSRWRACAGVPTALLLFVFLCDVGG